PPVTPGQTRRARSRGWCAGVRRGRRAGGGAVLDQAWRASWWVTGTGLSPVIRNSAARFIPAVAESRHSVLVWSMSAPRPSPAKSFTVHIPRNA
ncbi:hypothetical protein CEJ63_23425, partial [Acinetobacter baumannii]